MREDQRIPIEGSSFFSFFINSGVLHINISQEAETLFVLSLGAPLIWFGKLQDAGKRRL
jgi:hypothetical protein